MSSIALSSVQNDGGGQRRLQLLPSHVCHYISHFSPFIQHHREVQRATPCPHPHKYLSRASKKQFLSSCSVICTISWTLCLLCQYHFDYSNEWPIIQKLMTFYQMQELSRSGMICRTNEGPKSDMTKEERDNAVRAVSERWCLHSWVGFNGGKRVYSLDRFQCNF